LTVGCDTRVDDFTVIAAGDGGITLGSFVHVAVFSSLIGRGHIEMCDFSGLSSRVSIYSSSDDYLGRWMTNPTVPEEFTGAKHADVYLGRHVIIGAGSVILPGVVIEDGVAVAALSLVKRKCEEFGIYAGNPAKRVGERSRRITELEQEFIASQEKRI